MITIIALVALIGADDPILGPLNLDAKTREKIGVLSAKCADDLSKMEQAAVRSPKLRNGLAERMAAARAKRDSAIEALLNEEQKTKYKELRKQEIEGIPVGGGFNRSFYWKTERGGNAQNLDFLQQAVQAAQSASAVQTETVVFTLTYKGENPYRRASMGVRLFDAKNAPVGATFVLFEDVKPGSSKEVRIVAIAPTDRIEITFLEGEFNLD